MNLNKSHQFFYFQTRICGLPSVASRLSLWEKVLSVIDELNTESGVSAYGLVFEEDNLKLVFSTPYFNENILVLDCELRLKNHFQVHFERPILCEPISNWESLKKLLIELYRSQVDIDRNGIVWKNKYNSLKLILDGHRSAVLFKDPLNIVFQPQVVFQQARYPLNSLYR